MPRSKEQDREYQARRRAAKDDVAKSQEREATRIRVAKHRATPEVREARLVANLSEEAHERKLGQIRFIGIDGEGYNDPLHPEKPQTYFLLMSSEEYVHGQKRFKADRRGLSTLDCLNFLLEVRQRNPQHQLVCFGASYDVNMWLKDLPYNLIRKLHKTGICLWRRRDSTGNNYLFTLMYRKSKEFCVTRQIIEVDGDNKIISKGPKITAKVWDVIGFFQQKFVDALKSFFPAPDEQVALHLDLIAEEKENRNAFDFERIDQIKQYTSYEVDGLVQLMDKLLYYCKEARIRPSRFDGAGALSAALLKSKSMKEYLGYELGQFELEDRIAEGDGLHAGDIPFETMKASQYAFYGARIEACKVGLHVGKIWRYDVRSCYPSCMVNLPNVAAGTWKLVSNPQEIKPFAIYEIVWKFEPGQPFYPFLYRERGPGNIKIPPSGHAWQWGYEVIEVQESLKSDQLKGEILVLQGYEFLPGDGIRPYAFLTETYQLRKRYKDEGNGAAIALKLAINSVYGKTVQRKSFRGKEVTELVTSGAKAPRRAPYFQLQYGGATLSMARAKLWKAAMQAPESVIAFATDALWTTTQLDLDVSSDLGAWEETELDAFMSVQAGVYFYKEKDKEWKEKYRGYGLGMIKRQTVLEMWRENISQYYIPARLFITMGSALANPETFKERWGRWVDGSKMEQPDPITGTNLEPREGFRILSVWPHSGKRTRPEGSVHDLSLSMERLKVESIRRDSLLTASLEELKKEKYLSSIHKLPFSDEEEDEQHLDRFSALEE
jgi:hypothetical protein